MGVYSLTLTDTSLTTAANATALITAKSSTARVRIVEYAVSFQGVTASDVPNIVKLAKFTTDGTTPASTPTPVEWETPGRASDCTGALGLYATTPTLGDVYESHLVTPVGGLLLVQYGDRTLMPIIEPATRFGIEARAITNNVDVSATLVWEEI